MRIYKRDREYIKEMKNGFRLGVFGSRTLNNPKVREIIEDTIEKYNVKTIVTAAEIAGVSKQARRIARRRGLCEVLYSPDKDRFAQGCYKERSLLIAFNCDRLLIIWDGTSRGTKGEIDLCREQGLDYDLYTIENEEEYNSLDFDADVDIDG